MEKKKGIPADIRILLSEGIAGIILLILVFTLKPNADFAKGLFTGFGAFLVIIIILTIVFRALKLRKFGELDERERIISAKAAQFSQVIVTLGLALYVFLASAFPEVKNISAVVVALSAMISLTLLSGLGFIVLSRMK